MCHCKDIEIILTQLEPCQCTRRIPIGIRGASPFKENSIRGALPVSNQKLLSMCVKVSVDVLFIDLMLVYASLKLM